MSFPQEKTAALTAFYGPFALRTNGFPTAAWETTNLTSFVAPYPLAAAWDPSIAIKRIRCHRKVEESLRAILEGVKAHYGSIENIRVARMHLTGGVYNFRAISGTSRLSLHSYGAAIDLDPERNPLGKAWDENAGMMPMEVVDIFASAGWKWGGRFNGRKDCMHFQATA